MLSKQCFPKMTTSKLVPKSSLGILLLLLLLSGDVETNPGPKDKKGKEPKGPTVEEQLNDLKTALTEYETKIQGKCLYVDEMKTLQMV